MHDRATDQQPTWTPDGRYVLFTSDRTGIPNVHAYDTEQKTLHQVTNVLTGAYMPEVSPDGKTLVYVGYTSAGFDLFSMPLERSRWLAAVPAPRDRPDPPPESTRRVWPVQPYRPWDTLRPRAYRVEYGPGTFGPSLELSTSGTDVTGTHSFSASLTAESKQGEPAMVLRYGYHRLPFDLGLRASRRAVPRTSYRYGDERPIITERMTGITSGLSYTMPGEYDSQTAALSYTASHFDAELPISSSADPYSLVSREPHRGFLGSVHLGYTYDCSDGTGWGISSERGYRVGVGTDLAGPETGSEWTLAAFTSRIRGYVLLPWARHHVLALALSGGIATGSYTRQGLYYTGGFLDAPLLDAFTSGVDQSSFVLRGYEPAQFIGTQYQLLNVEYRLPLLYVDRGVSTLPVFLRSISAAAFADYGGAYDWMDLEHPLDSYHLGVGAELWVSLLLGYYAGANVRLGYAYGTDSEALEHGQLYVVAAGTF
jgi:hypothetical protein